MAEKLKLHWCDIGMGIGNAYGYSTHARNMKRHVAEIADIRPDADISLQIQTADKFQPVPGKYNVLFTMYEADEIPHSFIAGIQKADHIIVPCEHNKRIFRPHCSVPIDVCHEGCNPDIYTYQERHMPRLQPFRFLWVGAPNPRKGWEEVVAAWWAMDAKDKPEIELYLKTTMGELHEKKWNVTYDSRNLSLKELVALYHSAHCFLFPTRGEGWGLCGRADTMLHTRDSISTFKTVQPGDYILSGDGTYHLVLDKTQRPINSLYKVKAKYVMDTDFTAEHPYYTIRKKGKRLNAVTGAPEWVNVQHLQRGDLLCIPKARYANDLPATMTISDYVDNVQHDGNGRIYRKMGFSPARGLSYAAIIAKYNTSKKRVEKAVRYMRGDSRISSPDVIRLAVALQEEKTFSLPEPVKMNNTVMVDDGFLSFCGWYLAEGSTDGSRIEIDLHAKEIPVAQRLSQWVAEALGIDSVIEMNGDNKCRLRISSGILAELMTALFGRGCSEKRIPFFIEQGGNKLGAFIRAIFEGDGHFSMDNKMIVLAVTSPHIAFKVRDILTSVDILSGLSVEQRGDHKPIYEVSIPRPMIDKFLTFIGMEPWGVESRIRHFIERDDAFFVPVTSVERYDTAEDVYDICVDDTHCFVANGVLVHNTLTEAMATGVPCIATQYSGTADFFDSYVGYPIRYDLRQFYHGQYDLHTHSAAPQVEHLAELMVQVYNNYTEAKVKGKLAARRIRHKFTWQKAAQRLVEILSNIRV